MDFAADIDGGVCGRDFTYRLTAGGLVFSFTAEMEAW